MSRGASDSEEGVLAVSVGQVGSAVQADPAGRGELAVQADPAVGKRPIVRLRVQRAVLAVAPVLRRGRTSAGREARRWAASGWAGPTRPSPTAAQ